MKGENCLAQYSSWETRSHETVDIPERISHFWGTWYLCIVTNYYEALQRVCHWIRKHVTSVKMLSLGALALSALISFLLSHIFLQRFN